jgi:hypothetical protein
MSSGITKEHAEKIAAKLEAVVEKGDKHDLAKIYHDGKRIAQYGIRRGSKKDSSHAYISSQIFVSKRDCLNLAKCPLSRDGWIEILKEKGKIEEE